MNERVVVNVDGSGKLTAIMLGKYYLDTDGKPTPYQRLTQRVSNGVAFRAKRFLSKHRDKVADRTMIAMLEVLANRMTTHEALKRCRWLEDVLRSLEETSKMWS